MADDGAHSIGSLHRWGQRQLEAELEAESTSGSTYADLISTNSPTPQRRGDEEKEIEKEDGPSRGLPLALQPLHQAPARDSDDDDSGSQGSVDSDPTPRFDTSALLLKYGSPAGVGRSSRSPANQKWLHDSLGPNEGDEDGDDSSVEAFGDIRIRHDLVCDDDNKTAISALTAGTRGPPGRPNPAAHSPQLSTMSRAETKVRYKELRRIKSSMSASGGRSTTGSSGKWTYAHGSANVVSTNTFFEDSSSDDDSDDEDMERKHENYLAMLQRNGRDQGYIDRVRKTFQLQRDMQKETVAKLSKTMSKNTNVVLSRIKQFGDQSKMANVQQSAALSNIQKSSTDIKGGVDSLGEKTTDLSEKVSGLQLQLNKLMQFHFSNAATSNADVASDSNTGMLAGPVELAATDSTSTNEILVPGSGVDAPITSSDRAASNASATAAIAVPNNGTGGGGDAVLPSEPGLSVPSTTLSGLSIAAGIQDVLPSDHTSMVLATDTVSASGTSRPAFISAAADPVPLADKSTVELALSGTDGSLCPASNANAETIEDISRGELASSGTDNPLRPASNANAETIEDTKTAVGAEAAPAHGSTGLSMAMLPTSTASGLLHKDTVDRPRLGPNPTASGKPNTNCRQTGPRLKASIGAARTTYSAKTPSISTTARTGTGGQKGIMRTGEAAAAAAAAAAGPEDEKENRVVLAKSKSKFTTRGLATSNLTNNAISLDLDLHHMEASDASPAISKATGEGLETKLKLSRPTIDDLCERIDALIKNFPESNYDVIPEIVKTQKKTIRILEDGAFLSAKAVKKFGAFLVTKVTDVRLNPSQPNLCSGWKDVTVALVKQVHIVSQDADVRDKFQKLIAPPLHSLCQSYLSALKSSVGPIRLHSREAMRHLTSLLIYSVFSDILAPICSGLLTGEDHILQESCAHLLLYAVALGSEASISKVEKGRPGKLGLVSKAIIAGVTASKDFVRRDSRVATHRLFARKELGEIKSAVEENLETNRRKALEDSVDYCNDKWASEGQLWCKDNGYLPQS